MQEKEESRTNEKDEAAISETGKATEEVCGGRPPGIWFWIGKHKTPIRDPAPGHVQLEDAFHIIFSKTKPNKNPSEVTKINLIKTENNVTWSHYW